jgi:hypothetical protein
MTRVTHRCNGGEINAQSADSAFLITDGNRGYLALSSPNASNYFGYCRHVDALGTYAKILWDIAPQDKVSGLVLDGRSAVRETAQGRQEFSLLHDGMLMRASGASVVTLDCKRFYDESEQGRMYSVEHSEVDGRHLFSISYTKYHDASLSSIEYVLHVAVATTMRAQLLQRWREVSYGYDVRRGTHSTPWVFDLLSIEGEGAVSVALGASADDARRKAAWLLDAKIPPADDPALPALPLLAWRSLHSLETDTGILAGLPWFFQEWSRDELTSLGGLLAAKSYSKTIAILDKWYGAVRADGTLPAIYPDQGLTSSDAPGWLGKRTRDLLVRLSDEGILHQLPAQRIAAWRDKTGMLLDQARSRMRDGLIWSESCTTWMDTRSNDDGRAGARIEIQALHLALYDAHAHLCALTRTPVAKERSDAAQAMLRAVHERLVEGDTLLDGLFSDGTPDRRVRPNLFLAWYVAPKLFTDDMWSRFFATALPSLWLSWGGLSSIGASDHNFHADYSGEDVASYHRGDSWYFINNIAAMAMHAIDPVRYGEKTRAIVGASMRDLLGMGFCGHVSEVSAARQQEADGCHSQAWSASTLLEALLRIEVEKTMDQAISPVGA